MHYYCILLIIVRCWSQVYIFQQQLYILITSTPPLKDKPAEQIYSTFCCLKESLPTFKDKKTLKSQYKKVLQTSKYTEKEGFVILTLNKIGVEQKLIQGDKEGYFILNSEMTGQGEITILNNKHSHHVTESILPKLKAHINYNSIILSDSNTLLFQQTGNLI